MNFRISRCLGDDNTGQILHPPSKSLQARYHFTCFEQLSFTIVTITISFSVFQLVFRNMGRHIREIQISLHVFIVSIFGFYIVVKCCLILPEGVGLAQPSLVLVVFQYWSSYSPGLRFHTTKQNLSHFITQCHLAVMFQCFDIL